MPSTLNHYVTDYQVVTADSAALLTAAVAALIATGWQPWGSPFADSHGASVEYHQAMVTYGPELA